MAANQSYGAVSAGSTKRKVAFGLVLAALFATAAVPAYDSRPGTITNYGDGIIPAEPAPPAENVVELGTVNQHGGMKIIGGEAGPAGIRDMTPEESAAAEQQRAWGQQQLAASKNTLADSQNMLGSVQMERSRPATQPA